MKAKDVNTYPIFKDAVFEQAFEKAALANLGTADLDTYENSLKVYRDLKGVVDTAFDEGRMEGKVEEKMEIARTLKQKGMTPKEISEITGLSEEAIKSL